MRYVREQRSFSLPRLGRRALGAIGAAYDEMRDALAGRNYVADYVQTLTHEVKGPLSAIRGAAELLQEPMADADRSRFIANIARETQRIQELVDRMLELTALESRKSLDRATPVPLRRARRRGGGERGAGGAGARPDVAMAGPAPTATIVGDAFLLQRAVANLIDNALDFSPPGGAVTIEVVATRAAATSSSATPARASPSTPKTRCSRSSIRWPGRRRRRRAPAWACRSSRRSPICTAAGSTLKNAAGGGAVATLVAAADAASRLSGGDAQAGRPRLATPVAGQRREGDHVVELEADADRLADRVVVVRGHERQHRRAAVRARSVYRISAPRKALARTSALTGLASSWTTSSGRSSTVDARAGRRRARRCRRGGSARGSRPRRSRCRRRCGASTVASTRTPWPMKSATKRFAGR